MKKNLKRILGIMFTLILGYQHFCYADVVEISPIEEMAFPIGILIGIIAVIVLALSAITYFILKEIEIGNKKIENESEEIKKESQKRIETAKNIITKISYACAIAFIVSILLFLIGARSISLSVIFPIIILFLAIYIILKNKKTSKKYTAIITLICISICSELMSMVYYGLISLIEFILIVILFLSAFIMEVLGKQKMSKLMCQVAIIFTCIFALKAIF